MKRPRILRFLIVLWLVILTLWLSQGAIYSHTLYEVKQAGEVIERYGNRGAGLEVEAIPIYEPDNPLWVDITRSIAPVILFLLPCYIIAIEFDFRKKRKAPSPSNKKKRGTY